MLSFYIRNYVLVLPSLNILGLDPIITEYFILNGLFGFCAYHFTGIHYSGGFPALGSVIYLFEYFVIIFILYILVYLLRLFVISDIYSLILTMVITLWINIKISNY